MAREKTANRRLFIDLLIRSVMDIVNIFISLMIIALVARALTESQYGIYTQIITTVSFLVPIFLIRLNTACTRYFPQISHDPTAVKDYYSTIIFIIGLSVSLGAVVILVFSSATAALVFGVEIDQQVMILFAIFLVARSLATFSIDFFRSVNQTSTASLFNSLRLVFVLLGIFVIMTGMISVENVLLVHIIGEGSVFVIISLKLFHRGVLGIPRGLRTVNLKPYFHYALPLIPYTIFIAVNQFADRYFVAHIIGLEAAGLYALVYSMVTAAFFLNTTISYVIFPHLSELWKENKSEEIKKIIDFGIQLYMLAAIPIVFGLILVLQPLVIFLADKVYDIPMDFVAYIAVGHLMLGLAMIIVYLIDLSQKTTYYVKIIFIASVVNIGLNYMLVPVLGIQGAAASTMLTYGVQLIGVYIVATRMLGFSVDVDFRFIAKCLLGSALMFMVLREFTPIENIYGMLRVVVAGIIIYGLTVFALARKDVKAFRQYFLSENN